MIKDNELGEKSPNLEATNDALTPAMEDAGVWALRTAGIGLLDAEDWEVRQVAREVYRAMHPDVAVVNGSEPRNLGLSQTTG